MKKLIQLSCHLAKISNKYLMKYFKEKIMEKINILYQNKQPYLNILLAIPDYIYQDTEAFP